MIWFPPLHAFVHTRLHLGVDGDIVEEDLATAIESGDIIDDDEAVAAFCADYFDVSAGIFRSHLMSEVTGNASRSNLHI